MQIGIRLHDVNSKCAPELQTLEARAAKAREEGFTCVHLAPQKVMQGITFDDAAMTGGMAMHFRRVFEQHQLDIAVLGCYLNLAHPDAEKLEQIKKRYYSNIRVASLCGACVVGTETGAPNAEYKYDSRCHTNEALSIFMHNLADVVECAEHFGVMIAIEPVWNHIVYNADRALEVINGIQSHNLRIILDPVNLLSIENAYNRSYVINDAIQKLGDYVAMVHIKDYIRSDSGLVSVAAGTGEMDYCDILRFMKTRKPFIHATLENTSNDNAVMCRELIEQLFAQI